MKDTLMEIENNLQETTVKWMKPRVKSMIWNIKKQKTTNQKHKKKRIKTKTNKQKKRGECKQPLEKLQALQHLHHRGARRRIERARNTKSI